MRFWFRVLMLGVCLGAVLVAKYRLRLFVENPPSAIPVQNSEEELAERRTEGSGVKRSDAELSDAERSEAEGYDVGQPQGATTSSTTVPAVEVGLPQSGDSRDSWEPVVEESGLREGEDGHRSGSDPNGVEGGSSGSSTPMDVSSKASSSKSHSSGSYSSGPVSDSEQGG
jgi:hypothetical protein